MTTNDWALDTNYAMQQGVRRLISGCVEAADGRLWLPERALTLASDRYSRLARTRAARITEHREGAETPARSRATLDDITIERTLVLTDTFATWAQAETLRNDGLWSLAASSAHTRRLTQRLFIAGIAQEGHADTAEEDAHVAAEALSAGCRWISSNNLHMLQGKLFTEWLGVEQAQGRLTGARSPFILRADEAIAELVERTGLDAEKHHAVAAIAWELSRPNDASVRADTNARMRQAQRFATALERGGAPIAAGDIRETIRQCDRDATLMNATLESLGLTGVLERTRAGEERQVTAEREAIARTTKPAGAPTQGKDRV